jgi:hypothetical protein
MTEKETYTDCLGNEHTVFNPNLSVTNKNKKEVTEKEPFYVDIHGEIRRHDTLFFTRKLTIIQEEYHEFFI